MSTDLRKQQLLEKYLNNNCSRSELEELFGYLLSGEDQSYEEVTAGLWNRMHADKILEEDKAEQLVSRAAESGKVFPLRQRRSFLWRRVAAAVLILIVGAGLVRFFSGKRVQPVRTTARVEPPYGGNIRPGGAKAILRAGNAQVVLDKKDTSFVLAGNRVKINGGDVQVADTIPVQYTLATPRGGEYSLLLSDGSKVWLNADSRLVYPSVFPGDSRIVYLTGEAYFEVKTDAERPFIVHTGQQEIKVLGTEFNVKAYLDESESTTTLIRGKVQVNSFGKQLLLEKGQQAVTRDDGRLDWEKEADIKQAVAWKEGYFRFYNTGIHEIMKQLSRWYDVDVHFEEGLQPHEFLAIIRRDNDISQILGMLEGTGEVRFKVEGREIMVESNKQ